MDTRARLLLTYVAMQVLVMCAVFAVQGRWALLGSLGAASVVAVAWYGWSFARGPQ